MHSHAATPVVSRSSHRHQPFFYCPAPNHPSAALSLDARNVLPCHLIVLPCPHGPLQGPLPAWLARRETVFTLSGRNSPTTAPRPIATHSQPHFPLSSMLASTTMRRAAVHMRLLATVRTRAPTGSPRALGVGSLCAASSACVSASWMSTSAAAAAPANASLTSPVQLGALTLPNGIIVSPCTRNRGNVPGPAQVEYYVQRAKAGLIISEATLPVAQGYEQLHACAYTAGRGGGGGPREEWPLNLADSSCARTDS